MKRALQDPGVKPLAVLRYAELNELCEGQESALQFLQYAVDQPATPRRGRWEQSEGVRRSTIWTSSADTTSATCT